MVKQVNLQLELSIGSVGSNNLNYEPRKSSIPPHLRENYKPKAKGQNITTLTNKSQ